MKSKDDLPSMLNTREKLLVSCEKPRDMMDADRFFYQPEKPSLKPGEVKCRSCHRAAMPGMTRCATCRNRIQAEAARVHIRRQAEIDAARTAQKQCMGCPRWMDKDAPDRCPRCVALNEQRLANQQAKAAERKRAAAEKAIVRHQNVPGVGQKKCHSCVNVIAEDGPTRCQSCVEKAKAKRMAQKRGSE